MRKSKKRILNQAIVAALSASMTVPSVVAMANPITDETLSNSVKSELVIDDETKDDEKADSTSDADKEIVAEEETTKDQESEDETEDSKVDEAESEDETEESKDETSTETDDSEDELEDIEIPAEDSSEKKSETLLEKVEEVVENIVEKVTNKKTYEKFGSDAFILWWFDEATDEEKEEWYNSISKYEEDKATPTDAKYPAYSSDEFDDWFNEKAIKDTTRTFTVNGEETQVPDLNLTVLGNWIKYQSEEDAFDFINGVLSNYYSVLSANSNAVVNPTSVIGNLWPETWGANANYITDGDGTEESPYILDSVEDLRAFAKDVANGQFLNQDSYFYLKKGTYDLGGTWIPIGFCLNNGDSAYVPFDGHFAGQDGAVIKNLGFKASTSLNVGSELANSVRSQKYAGFFGITEGATINNIQIQTSGVLDTNAEMTGALVGCAIDTKIRDVDIDTSKVCGTTYVGGVVGVAKSSSASADARDTVIEDVTCSKVAVYNNKAVTSASDGVEGHGTVGGIVGLAQNASIIDTTVTTNTGAGNHIYGTHAFVGGIAGVIENSDVLNSFLQNGEVGDNDAFAVGGIVGGYNGGAVKVARFSGTVTRPTTTNNYSACFIGYRVGGTGFYYGENGDVAYLFADTKAKADTGICGSRIEDDGLYDSDAWIGYWHAADTYCTIVSGDNQEVPDDMFYQILEDGILNVKKGTKSGNGYENTDTINHYTADKSGNPTRGYLLSIENPLVDGVQAAEITAYVNGSYKETVSADNLGAFAPGDQVYIAFSDMKDNNGYYRMDDDANPSAWYSYYESGNKFYTYNNYDVDERVNKPTVEALRQNGGWVLTMPDSDAIVSAKYEKVAEAVTTNPAKVTFEVTQVRSGDRANPEVKWKVTAVNANGVPIQDSKGTNWTAVDPTNGTDSTSDDIRFWIGSMVNRQDNEKYNLTWRTSNTDDSKIVSAATPANGLTMEKTAFVTLNLNDSAINDKINELVAAQHAGGDKDAITTIEPYYYHSLVTAIADPEDCADKDNPPKGYCDITIKLNIEDNTNTKIDGVALSQNEMTYNVVRTLSGDRANPTVSFTVNGESASSVSDVMKLNATFSPDYFSNDSVHWYLSEEKDKTSGVESDFENNDDGTLNVSMSSSDSTGYRNASVTLKGVTKTSADNSFISGVIKAEDQKYTSQMMKNPGETTTYNKWVKVTAKDSVNNSVTDTCHVVVTIKTVDNTEIMPTKIAINNKTNINGYNITYAFKGNSQSEITSRVIRKADVTNTIVTDGVGEKPTATVYAGNEIYDNKKDEFTPYDDSITWELSVADATSTLNPYDVLNIDKTTGQITVRGYDDSTSGNGYSPWVQSLISEGRLDGTTVNIRVIARSVRDNSVVDFVDIPVTFKAASMSQDEADLTYDVVYTKKVGHSIASAGITEDGAWSGNGSKSTFATATGGSEAPVFTLQDDVISKIVEQSAVGLKTTVSIAPRTEAQWIQDVIASRATTNTGSKSTVLTAKTKNGTPLTTADVKVNFRYDGVDLTASVPTTGPEEYGEECVTSMASITDRDITMNVLASQGDAVQGDDANHLWRFGVVKVDNTTYSVDGVKENNATYELSGDLAKYVKVENGYLVPIKEVWESTVINKGGDSGSVSGVVTASKDCSGIKTTDSYHLTINFEYARTTRVVIKNAENLNGYRIFYTFEGNTGSKITKRDIRKTDEASTVITNGVGELPVATIYVNDDIYDGSSAERPYHDSVTWELAAVDTTTGLNPYDVLNIDKSTGQITVRGYDDSTSGDGFSPWIKSLIDENKLNGTTVTIRIIARSVLDNSITAYKDIEVTFAAGTMDTEEADLTYNMVYTKKVNHSVASAGIAEEGVWSGNGSKFAFATASGGNEAPVFTLSDNLLARIIKQSSEKLSTTVEVAPRTEAQWIQDIIDQRAEGNKGSKDLTLKAQTANGTSISTSDVKVNFRYDGVDFTASVPTATPTEYSNGEYAPSMASIKDRDISMQVTATQGNYTQDNPGTRTWQYGIVKLDNTTYSADGVNKDDATYTLSGDLAKYAKVENGYLVPIKGLWESTVINQNKTSGSISGVITASKDCSGITVTDSYNVTIDFRYDKAVVNQHEATFDVVYTEDSRTNSKLNHWTGDDYIQLYAQISDESGQDVTPIWESSDTDIVTVDKDGRVYVNEDTWIKDIIDAAKNDYTNEVHSGTKTVTVTAKHPTTGKTADTCTFTVNFRYDQAIMDHNEDVYTIIKTQTSRTINPSAIWSGNDIRKINAKMHVGPGNSTNVYWSSEDSKIVTVDDAGNIQPVIDADWMNEIINNKKYSGQKKVAVNVDNDKMTLRDSDNITINFIYEDVEMAENNKTMDITVTATGSSSSPTYTVTGATSAQLAAVLHSSDASETGLNWSSADSKLLTVDANGKLNLVLPTVTDKKGVVSQAQGATFKNNVHALIQEALKHNWTAQNNYITSGNVVITAASKDGRMADQCTVKLNIKYVNSTYTPSSGGSSGGSGGGGGGGVSSTGITPSGVTTKVNANLPSYVVTGGQWTKNALDKWFYTNGRTYTSEWAAITNPYADSSKGQNAYDWYHFNADSSMTTGWYTEGDYTYYLHPVGDGSQGRMYTGWNWIDDNNDGIAECYYFETESSGHKGSLYKSTTTPDGYTVNAKGQWMQNGQVITRDMTVKAASTLPSYVKTGGTWTKNANGQWLYANSDRQLKNEWAAINNPYADTTKGQPAFSWFHFNADGTLTTGWYTDSAKGATYYLNPLSDNTLGRMLTGWQWIDSNNDGVYECYYFEADNESQLGQLKRNTTIGNYTVNASGQWVDATGKVQTRSKSGAATTPVNTTTTAANTKTDSSSDTGSKKTVEINGTAYVTATGNLR